MQLTPTQQLQLEHRSVRHFLPRPLDPGLLESLIQCGQAAASSSFIQAYSVIRVTRPEVRSVIAEAAGGQRWIEEAPEFLVFCADLHRINHACETAGSGQLEGYAEHGLAAVVDVSLMAQNVLLAAESQGLAGVFIGGIRNDPQAVVDQLSLPELVLPVFGMCLGWPNESHEVKPRMPVGFVLHQDKYQEVAPERVALYDEKMAGYYASRGTNIKLSDWSNAVAAAVQGKKRQHMLAFLHSRGYFRR
jgi:nitroreductase